MHFMNHFEITKPNQICTFVASTALKFVKKKKTVEPKGFGAQKINGGIEISKILTVGIKVPSSAI